MAAGFQLLSDRGTENSIPLPISSLTLAKGDMLQLDVGATTWAVGDSGTQHWQLKAICMEPAASTATSVLALLVVPGQVWEVESANNSAAADNGDRMVLTDKNTVNNTGTDSTAQEACFVQLSTLGAAADKRIMGIIVPGTGVDPDAA